MSASPSAPPPQIINLTATYPQMDWDQGAARTKEYPLHYAIALNTSDVLTRIEQASSDQLNRCDEQAEKITPLMVAIIGQNNAALNRLLKLDKSRLTVLLEAKDALGWTALHHAAIVSEEMYDRLVDKGAKVDIGNTYGATPRHFLEQIKPKQVCWAADRIFVQNGAKTTPLSKLSPSAITKCLGLSTYRDSTYCPPNAIDILRHIPEDMVKIMPKEQIERYQKQPPQLRIQDCRALQKFSRAKELVAAEKIAANTLVGFYGGAYIPEIPKTFCDTQEVLRGLFRDNALIPYLFNRVSADPTGNAMRFANRGFPNLISMFIIRDGTPQPVFIAGKEMQNGESLLWNYGLGLCAMSYVQPALILGREELHAFYSAMPFSERFARIEKSIRQCAHQSPKTFDDLVKVFFEFECVLYPLGFPLAILDLHFNQIVLAKSWHEYLTNATMFLEKVSQVSPTGVSLLISLCRCIFNFESAFEKKEIENKETVRTALVQWINGKMGTLSLVQFMKAFELYAQSQEPWTRFIEMTEQTIVDYNWETDEMAPLSIEHIQEARLEAYNALPPGSQAHMLKSYLEYFKGGDEAGKANMLWLIEQIEAQRRAQEAGPSSVSNSL